MLGRLQQLTQSVAVDVGKHQSRVREINSDLTAETPAESGVVAAVKNLIRANETMQTQLSTAEERLQVQTQELGRYMREARTDALTKLLNRRAFDDELKLCVESMQRTGRPSCLLLIDLDRFKKFNDLYGHATGDAVLRGVADILRAGLQGERGPVPLWGRGILRDFPGCGPRQHPTARGEPPSRSGPRGVGVRWT